MRSLLKDLTLAHYDYFVSVFYCGESMSHDDACLALILHESIQGLLYLVLTFCIQSAGCFIQKDDLRLAY